MAIIEIKNLSKVFTKKYKNRNTPSAIKKYQFVKAINATVNPNHIFLLSYI